MERLPCLMCKSPASDLFCGDICQIMFGRSSDSFLLKELFRYRRMWDKADVELLNELSRIESYITRLLKFKYGIYSGQDSEEIFQRKVIRHVQKEVIKQWETLTMRS